MRVSRALPSTGWLLLGVWILALVAAGIFLHSIAWLILFFTAVGLGLSFLVNVGTEAGANWSKALYGDDPESKNHWSRKQR